MRRRPITLLAALAAAAVIAAPAAAGVPTTPIRHIVVLMQENHSFDNYFGTYPGVDGLPAGTCLPRSFVDATLGCARPSHVGGRAVQGLASDTTLFARQLHGGSMDGFVAAYRVGRGLGGLPNPLGYYDNRDIPYVWNLADRYVLFDRFFSSARGGSAWNHMFAISATPGNPTALCAAASAVDASSTVRPVSRTRALSGSACGGCGTSSKRREDTRIQPWARDERLIEQRQPHDRRVHGGRRGSKASGGTSKRSSVTA